MWWMEADPERTDDEKMAKKMGTWCKQMPGGRETYVSCIEGIANRIQLLTNEDPLKTAAICALITDDPNIRYLCQEQSARRYTIYYPLSTALNACEGLGELPLVEKCKESATVATRIRRADQVTSEPSVMQR